MQKQENIVKVNYNIGKTNDKSSYKMALKVFVSMLLLVLVFVVFGTMLLFENLLLAIIINLAFISLCAYFFMLEGIHEGNKQAGLSEITFKQMIKNKEERLDTGACFYKHKGFFAVLLGVLPLFLLCVVFAFLTEKQFTSLGTLPAWVENYMVQPELQASLAYYYAPQSIGFIHIYRLIVRTLNMPYIAMVSYLGTDAMLWVERLCPLLIWIIPSFYSIGYLRGPKSRVAINKAIQRNVKRKQLLQQQKTKEVPEKKQLI
ncbi:MAG: hypothetical protein SPL05_00050 [Eubacteriales bacterium]|nr:hypothetical protein [Eubacteriales bacterium]